MNRRYREARKGWLLILPLMIGCMVFYAISFGMVLQYSVTQGDGGMSNYRALLENRIFRLAFWNTIRFLLAGLPLIMLLAYAVALALKKYTQKYNSLKTVLMLPYVMPVVGTVVLVKFLFAQYGIVNRGLYALGLPVADWLSSDKAFYIFLALYLWKNTGYTVILLLSGLVTIPEDHYAAASLDGASALQQFRCITVPQMWRPVFFAVVFSLINAFKSFREIFLIGGTHPHSRVYMLQHFINNNFENLNYGRLSAASVLLFLILTAAFALFYHWVNRKEAYRE